MRLTKYDRDALDGKPLSTLRLELKDVGSGWIELELISDETRVPIACSSVFDPFHDFLVWLESIVLGVQRCSFLIEEEGPEKIFWAKRFYGDIYQLKILKSWGPNKEILNCYIHKAQLMEAFYGSTVKFYFSEHYNRDKHEIFTIEDKFVQNTGRKLLQDSHIQELLKFKGKSLRHLFLALKHETISWNSSLNSRQNCLQWIKMTLRKKETYAFKSIRWFETFDTDTLEDKYNAIFRSAKYEVSDYGYAFNLKRFHSVLIEHYLLNQSTKDFLHMDSLMFDYKITCEEEETYLKIIPYVNSIALFLEYAINIFCLNNATKTSGEYALFTCTCGDEGCGGIERSPQVIVDETTVTWTIYEPSSYTFQFDKETLIKTISHLKKMLLHEKSLQEWETIEYTPCTCVADFLKSA